MPSYLTIDEVRVEEKPGPSLKREDPIQYEVFFHRLRQICQTQRETVRMISASPVVRDAGEVTLALFTPQGESVVMSEGLILHIPTVGWTIQYMLENGWDRDPGFREGDHFFNNDPHVAGYHAPDQFVVTPIFWEGELVGWVGSVSHSPETGACEPGGIVASSKSRFDEGLLLPCVRVAVDDRPLRDIFHMMDRSVRDPRFQNLDTRAKITAMAKAREELKRLIATYGVDYWRRALLELIEDGERQARAKIARLPDGIYRSRIVADFHFTGSRERRLAQIPCAITLEGDRMVVDLDGASGRVPGPFNGALPGIKGEVICGLLIQLFYDCKDNQGTFAPLEVRATENTLVNCRFQDPVVTFIATTGMAVMFNVHLALSHALYAAGYPDEAMASRPFVHALGSQGADTFGRPMISMNLEVAALGHPAAATHDGEDAIQLPTNPEGDMADVEAWETHEPLLYLARRYVPDLHGFGKYRGGSSFESIRVVSTEECEALSFGMNSRFQSSNGLHGGYPSPTCFLMRVRGGDVFGRIERGEPLPTTFEEAREIFGERCEFLEANWGCEPYRQGDILGMRYAGGGGYGDPLLRDPRAVMKDLRGGFTSAYAAREVYGVVYDEGSLEARLEATEERRCQMREERRRRGLPAADYIQRWRERIQRGELPELSRRLIDELLSLSPRWAEELRRFWGLEGRPSAADGLGPTPEKRPVLRSLLSLQDHLEIVELEGGGRIVRCGCGHLFGDYRVNWKLAALVYDRDPQEIYPHGGRAGDSAFNHFREFYCPGCGVQLDVESITPGLPFLFNAELQLKIHGEASVKG